MKRVPPQAGHRDVRVHQDELPHIYLYTSTNGLAFSEAEALGGWRTRASTRSLFRSTARPPQSYGKYRQRGRFDIALANLRAMADEKRRRRPGSALPQLAIHPSSPGTTPTRRWTSRGTLPPTPAWTGSVGSSPITRRMRTRAVSCRGSVDVEAIRHEIWDNNNLGNAIPGATPRARIDGPHAGPRPFPDGAHRPRAPRPYEGAQFVDQALSS